MALIIRVILFLLATGCHSSVWTFGDLSVNSNLLSRWDDGSISVPPLSGFSFCFVSLSRFDEIGMGTMQVIP